jgi:hypothetical protein
MSRRNRSENKFVTPSLRGVGGPRPGSETVRRCAMATHEVCPFLARSAGVRRGHDHVDILRSSTDALGEQLGGLGVSQPNTDQEGVMADVLADVLHANNRYAASFGERGKLPLPQAWQFAILTCAWTHALTPRNTRV